MTLRAQFGVIHARYSDVGLAGSHGRYHAGLDRCHCRVRTCPFYGFVGGIDRLISHFQSVRFGLFEFERCRIERQVLQFHIVEGFGQCPHKRNFFKIVGFTIRCPNANILVIARYINRIVAIFIGIRVVQRADYIFVGNGFAVAIIQIAHARPRHIRTIYIDNLVRRIGC